MKSVGGFLLVNLFLFWAVGTAHAQERDFVPRDQDLAENSIGLRGADGRRNVRGWPLVYSVHDGEQRETDLAWPLYHSESSPDHKRIAIRPFFDYEWDRELDHTEWNLLWPFVKYERDADSSSLDIRPLFWSREGPEGGHAHFVPFAFSSWSKDSRVTVAPPFFWYFRNGDAVDLHMWPLFGRHDLDEGGTRFFTLGHTTWWDTGRPDAGSFAFLWPLSQFHWSKDEAGGHVLPFYFYGKSRKSRWNTMVPLWYSYRDPQTMRFWTLPYAYSETSTEIRHDLLFPFLTHARGKHDKSLTVAARPLFWYDRTPQHTTVTAIPFGYYRGWANGDKFAFGLPFYHESFGNRSTTIVPPLWWSKSSPERQSMYLFPFYGQFKEEHYRKDMVLFPLFARTRDHQETSWDLMWPLLNYTHSPKGNSMRAMPFFWYDNRPDGKTVVVPPAFWHHSEGKNSQTFLLPVFGDFKTGHSRTTVVGPYVRHRSDEWNLDAVLPIAMSYKDKTSEFNAIAPLFWDYKEGDERTTVAGPYVRHRDGDQKLDSLLPLLWWYRDSRTSFKAVAPIYWDYEESGTRTLLLGNYFHHRTPSASMSTLFPLYWDIDPAGPDRTTHLWPIFGKKREGDYTEYSTLWPLFKVGSGGGRTRVDLGWPLISHETRPDEVHSRVLPLYWYNRSKEDWSLDLLWPILHAGGGENRTDVSLLQWLLTYEQEGQASDLRVMGWWYRYRNDLKEDEVQHDLLPLWTYERKGDRGKANVLWPILSTEWDGDGSEYEIMWKLANYKRTDEEIEFRMFHKFVHYRATEDSYLLEVNPLFSYERRGDRAAFDLLGGLYYWERNGLETNHGVFWAIDL